MPLKSTATSRRLATRRNRPNRARAEFFQIHHRAQRLADQPLDFNATTVDAAACNVARFPRLCRIPEHGIFGCEPAASHALLFHPARYCFFDGDTGDHWYLPMETSTEPLA